MTIFKIIFTAQQVGYSGFGSDRSIPKWKRISSSRTTTTSAAAAAAARATPTASSSSSSAVIVAVVEDGSEKGGDSAGPRPHLALPLHAVESTEAAGNMDLQLEGLRDNHHLHHHSQLRHHDARREARQRGQGHPLGTTGE